MYILLDYNNSKSKYIINRNIKKINGSIFTDVGKYVNDIRKRCKVDLLKSISDRYL
jgi:hypothetical protein